MKHGRNTSLMLAAAHIITMRMPSMPSVVDLYADDPRRHWNPRQAVNPTLYHSVRRTGHLYPGHWKGDGIKPRETRQMRRHPTGRSGAKHMNKT